MEIKNIVESAATVTRVQTLHKGDIYKRVEADNGGRDHHPRPGHGRGQQRRADRGERHRGHALRVEHAEHPLDRIHRGQGRDRVSLDGPELSLISSQMFRDLDSAERDARKSLALIIEKQGMLRSLITPNDNDDKENH